MRFSRSLDILKGKVAPFLFPAKTLLKRFVKKALCGVLILAGAQKSYGELIPEIKQRTFVIPAAAVLGKKDFDEDRIGGWRLGMDQDKVEEQSRCQRTYAEHKKGVEEVVGYCQVVDSFSWDQKKKIKNIEMVFVEKRLLFVTIALAKEARNLLEREQLHQKALQWFMGLSNETFIWVLKEEQGLASWVPFQKSLGAKILQQPWVEKAVESDEGFQIRLGRTGRLYLVLGKKTTSVALRPGVAVSKQQAIPWRLPMHLAETLSLGTCNGLQQEKEELLLQCPVQFLDANNWQTLVLLHFSNYRLRYATLKLVPLPGDWIDKYHKRWGSFLRVPLFTGEPSNLRMGVAPWRVGMSFDQAVALGDCFEPGSKTQTYCSVWGRLPADQSIVWEPLLVWLGFEEKKLRFFILTHNGQDISWKEGKAVQKAITAPLRWLQQLAQTDYVWSEEYDGRKLQHESLSALRERLQKEVKPDASPVSWNLKPITHQTVMGVHDDLIHLRLGIKSEKEKVSYNWFVSIRPYSEALLNSDPASDWAAIRPQDVSLSPLRVGPWELGARVDQNDGATNLLTRLPISIAGLKRPEAELEIKQGQITRLQLSFGAVATQEELLPLFQQALSFVRAIRPGTELAAGKSGETLFEPAPEAVVRYVEERAHTETAALATLPIRFSDETQVSTPPLFLEVYHTLHKEEVGVRLVVTDPAYNQANKWIVTEEVLRGNGLSAISTSTLKNNPSCQKRMLLFADALDKKTTLQTCTIWWLGTEEFPTEVLFYNDKLIRFRLYLGRSGIQKGLNMLQRANSTGRFLAGQDGTQKVPIEATRVTSLGKERSASGQKELRIDWETNMSFSLVSNSQQWYLEYKNAAFYVTRELKK